MSVKLLVDRAVCQEPKSFPAGERNGFAFPASTSVKVISDKMEFYLKSTETNLMGFPVLEPVLIEAEIVGIAKGKNDLYLTVSAVSARRLDGRAAAKSA